MRMTNIFFRALISAFALASASSADAQVPKASTSATPIAAPADLILVNGRVYTVDPSHPMVSAFAVRNGRILFAGSDREVRTLAGPRTRVIDAAGGTVIPGMVDAHAHPT